MPATPFERATTAAAVDGSIVGSTDRLTVRGDQVSGDVVTGARPTAPSAPPGAR